MVIILLFSSAPSAFASQNIWYDKYVALDNNIGGNFYTNENSNALAWDESYVLRSYLELHDMTGSTSWLNKLTSHVDGMIANASDHDGDGYLGWDTYVYTPVELDNTGFETANATDSTLPDQWIRFQSNSSTAYRSNTSSDKYNGSWGLVLNTNGTSWQSLYQNMNAYEPNTKYVLRFYAKTNGYAAQGKSYVRDLTTNTVLNSVVFSTRLGLTRNSSLRLRRRDIRCKSGLATTIIL